MQVSDFTKSWTDTLTTLSVGSFAFFLPLVTNVDPDRSLSIAFGEIPIFFKFAENLGTAASIIMSIMLLSIFMTIGSFVMQFGEFIALLPDMKCGRQRIKERIEYASNNAAFMLMFANAYTSYRLLCGFGGLLTFYASALLFRAVFELNLQIAFFGLFLFPWGVLILLKFARYSFTAVDWVLFGDLHE